jgi:hypothetical protein
MPLPRLKTDGHWFVDPAGRRVLLRGVNLGGDCKVPFTPDGRTHLGGDFADHRSVSFVGRPFPLNEADEHLGRLRHWGFNALRLLTTWEAVEHEGPGRYDRAYLDYLAQVSRKAGAHSFWVFLDFHQDAWSRMSGGDGAPGWTFEAAGLDFRTFDRAGAALVMQHKYDTARGGRQEDRYPQMSWGWNYRMPANAIMWTLFFGGNAFAPGFTIEGVPAQDYLQGAYLGAMRELAKAVADQDHVLGFDTLNEPSFGWIGKPLSYRHVERSAENPHPVQPGPAWSVADGLRAARGERVTIPFLAYDPETRRVHTIREDTVNPDGVSIYLPGRADPFAGVSREDHFTHEASGRAYQPEADFMAPFFNKVAETTRAIRPDWLVFAEVDPFRGASGETFPEGSPKGMVNASHWYDLGTLVRKTFRVPPDEAAEAALRQRYTAELARLKAMGTRMHGGAIPSLVGEFGIPFDLNGAAAYAAWANGDRAPQHWRPHETALSLMYDAMDALLLHSTQWNYTASNRNDLAIGDGWNQEDLSIWSADQTAGAHDPDSGGRGVAGFCRPFVRVWAGEPVSQSFDARDGVFRAELDADPALGASEIYIPARHFPDGLRIAAEGARIEADPALQLLKITALRPGPMTITVRRR